MPRSVASRKRPSSARWGGAHVPPRVAIARHDALRVKLRDEATVRSKAMYLALAMLPDATRDILGLRIEQTEGANSG